MSDIMLNESDESSKLETEKLINDSGAPGERSSEDVEDNVLTHRNSQTYNINETGNFNTTDGNIFPPQSQADRYEQVLGDTGFGLFSIWLLVACGIALMSDTTEILCVSFVLPSAEQDLCLSDLEKGIIGSVIFLGMLVGGYTWGALADQIGRRLSLFISLLINGLFGCASAFANSAYLFAALRFISGVGVGASLPVVFSYYAEFLTKKSRGRLISWLSLFWMCGQITTSLFALTIIPKTFEYQLGSIYFSSWRAFVLICALPAFTSMIIFLFMPSSPRYLLVKGKTAEAIKVLSLIQRMNNIFKRKKIVYQVEDFMAILAGDSVSVSEWKPIGGAKPPKKTISSTVSQYFIASLKLIVDILKKTANLFRKSLFSGTILLTIIIFSLSFSSYGITLWFPQYVKTLLQNDHVDCDQFIFNSSYESYYNKTMCDKEINSSLIDNSIYFENFYFRHVTFRNLNISSLTFINSNMKYVTFENVTINNFTLNRSTISSVSLTTSNILFSMWSTVSASKLYLTDSDFGDMLFINSYINKLGLYDTNISYISLYDSTLSILPNSNSSLAQNQSCIRCSIEFSTQSSCNIIFDEDYNHRELYLESLYFALATLPGNLITITLIDFFPRKWFLSVVLLVSGLSVFALWRITIEWVAVLLLCVFNGVSIMAWNIINVITAESFPTSVRSTGSGYLSVINRIAAVISVNLFGVFIDFTPAIPIVLVASFMCIGAVTSLFLSKPEKNSLK